MGHDGDVLDLGLTDDSAQDLLQRITGIVGAFLVVIIVEHAGARRPGEDHRGNISARIVHDLRKTINGILKCVVETVHEYHHTAAPGQVWTDPAGQFHISLERRHADGGEILLRIGRQLLRPLHFTHLAVLFRGNGYDYIIDRYELVALTREKNARIIGRAARSSNDKIDLGRAGRSDVTDRHKHTFRPAGATGEQRHQNKQYRGCLRKNAPQNHPLKTTLKHVAFYHIQATCFHLLFFTQVFIPYLKPSAKPLLSATIGTHGDCGLWVTHCSMAATFPANSPARYIRQQQLHF